LKIGIIGAGSWGTTLADLLAKKGFDIFIWAFEEEVAKEINEKKENSLYLPGAKLHPSIKATSDFKEVTRGAYFLINAVPTQFIREVWSKVISSIPPDVFLINASKGIETLTLKTPIGIFVDLFGEEIKRRFGTLSGPSFAKEVFAGLPTAVTLSSQEKETAEKMANLFRNPKFRVYTHEDIIGVELAGALKNVIAIAAGVSEGLGLGQNAQAALITRGLAEMVRLGVSLGAKAITFLGLSGVGDLVLTCTGDLSRNKSVGLKIAKGKKPQEIISKMRMVAEGVETVKAVMELSKIKKIEMPISKEVHLILHNGKDPKKALADLMVRIPKPEFYWEDVG